MTRTVFSFLICAIVFGNQAALAQQDSLIKLTLEQCVQTAITNNLQVKQNELLTDASKINYNQAKRNLLPDLAGNLGHGINQGRSIDPFTNAYINQQVTFANYSISSGIILFNGFQQQHTIKQNQLAYAANTQELQQSKESLTLNVILAYLQILNNQDQLKQARQQLEVTSKQLERLDILNKSGAIAPALYYDLKGQYANDQLAIVNNQNAVNSAKLSLVQLMNVPYNKDLIPEQLTSEDFEIDYAATPSSIIEIANNQLPLIKATALRQSSAAQAVKIARGVYYPTIDFSASLNTNYSNAARTQAFVNTVEVPSGDYVTVSGNKVPVFTQRSNFSSEKINYGSQFNNNYSTSFYLNIRVPIFNRFRTKSNVALAQIDLANATLIANTTKTQLSQTIEQAYFNLTAAIERYKTLTRQVADFSESFRIAEVRFTAGAITQVDYLVAKNNVDRANINLIIARYDFAFRTKILDYYQGKLKL